MKKIRINQRNRAYIAWGSIGVIVGIVLAALYVPQVSQWVRTTAPPPPGDSCVAHSATDIGVVGSGQVTWHPEDGFDWDSLEDAIDSDESHFELDRLREAAEDECLENLEENVDAPPLESPPSYYCAELLPLLTAPSGARCEVSPPGANHSCHVDGIDICWTGPYEIDYAISASEDHNRVLVHASCSFTCECLPRCVASPAPTPAQSPSPSPTPPPPPTPNQTPTSSSPSPTPRSTQAPTSSPPGPSPTSSFSFPGY